MAPKLREMMDELRAITPLHNQAADEATSMVQRLQKFLNDDGFGFVGESSIAVGDGEDPSNHDSDIPQENRSVALRLCYGRTSGGNYGIYVRREIFEGLDYSEHPQRVIDCSTKAWSSCSRDQKIYLAGEIPSLVAGILENARMRTRANFAGLERAAQCLEELGVPDEMPTKSTAGTSAPPLRASRKAKA